MTTKCYLVYYLLICICLSCNKETVTTVEDKKGRNMFYISEDSQCGSIDVTISGVKKTITSSAGKSPSCSHSGSAIFELDEGTYSYTASCQQAGQTWSGQINVYKGQCYMTELVLDKKPEVKEGTILFWLDKDMGCGQIDVVVNNVSQKITTFVTSTTNPSCDSSSNGAIFKLLPGHYEVKASCAKYNWKGEFDIVKGQCQIFKLVAPVEIIPTYSFSAPGLLTNIESFYTGSNWNEYRITDSDNLVRGTMIFNSSNGITWSLSKSIVSTPSKTFFSSFKGSYYRPLLKSFVTNKAENTIFAIVYERDSYEIASQKITGKLYQISVETAEVKIIADATILGRIQHLIINSENELIATTDLDNGSLIKINVNGTIEKIATNLIQPANFCQYKSDYFVTINDVTSGSVLKISSNGKTENIVSNVLKPWDIVFDNEGNFVLKYEKTITGANYFVYDLYTAGGKFISNIVDSKNLLIVSNPVGFVGMLTNFEVAPMYIDRNNNLIFDHIGGNPISNGLRGFWRIGLKKIN